MSQSAIQLAMAPGRALHAMTAYRHFCVYEVTPSATRPGKTDKIPKVPVRWGVTANLLSFDEAHAAYAERAASGQGVWGVGYILQSCDPFFFLDVDGCLDLSTNQWKPIVSEVMQAFPGSAFEVSSSRSGIHLFGSAAHIAHGNKYAPLGLELYTEGRLAALTGLMAQGDCSRTFDLQPIVDKYFPPAAAVDATPVTWEDEPCDEWRGIADDDELIEKFLNSHRVDARAAFTGVAQSATNRQVWEADEEALAAAFPPTGDGLNPWDGSGADMSLAARLAFWTGKNPVRMLRLMEQSALVRDKWEQRPEYLVNTIERAIGRCERVYGQPDETPKRPVEWTSESLDPFPCALEAGAYTAKMVESKNPTYRDAWNSYDLPTVVSRLAWKFGSNCEKILEELQFHPSFVDSPELREAIAITCAATEKWASGDSGTLEHMDPNARLIKGDQYFRLEQQLDIFKGYVFVARLAQVYTPRGELYDQTTFNAMMPPGVYSISTNDEVVKKPWDAFLFSQILEHPRVDDLDFRPDLPPGTMFSEEGIDYVNTYVPAVMRRAAADVTPFLHHLELMIPIERDREILLAYMAAVVQYPGVKFRWAPVLQGWEGNGKGLVMGVLQKAIGNKFYHMAQASDVGNKFNDWIVGKLLVGVNEVNLAGGVDMIDSLKTMITDDYIGVQGKGKQQKTARIFANFVFTTNREGAMGKAVEGRRYAVFYTAQKTAEDVEQQMGNGYFKRLHDWLEAVGYLALNDFLASYSIPAEFNPAAECVTAPRTSSFAASVEASKGSVEQAIEEAIAEGQVGFRSPFISSHFLTEFLKSIHKENQVPKNKRADILGKMGYVPHPSLANGRSTKFLIPDNARSAIYVLKDHLAAQLSAIDVIHNYEKINGPQMVDTNFKSNGG